MNKRMPPRAVVVGSGFGGLAAAVRLGARCYRVTVLERRSTPGGRADVYRQDGFVFDAGPTIITAPFLLDKLWNLAGRKLADDIDLRPIDPFYRIRFDDRETLNDHGDAEAMAAEIGRIAPDDSDAYHRFLKSSARIFAVGLERLGHVSFADWRNMAAVAPDLIRLQSYRSVRGYVSRFVRDERIRIALSFHPLRVGGNPFETTSVYALIVFLEQRWGLLRHGRNRYTHLRVGQSNRKPGEYRVLRRRSRYHRDPRRSCSRCAADGRHADERRYCRLQCWVGHNISTLARRHTTPLLDRPPACPRAIP